MSNIRSKALNVFYISIICLVFLCSIFPASALERGAFEEFIVQIRVNYEKSTKISIVLKLNDGGLLVPIKDLEDFRIEPGYFITGHEEFQGIKYVNLKNLDQAIYHINEAILLLDITLPPDAMQIQYINVLKRPTDKSLITSQIPGAYINYNLNFNNTESSSYISGVHDINYFTENKGSLLMSVFTEKSIENHNKDQFTRLETNWTMDKLEDRARWRIGDSITKNAEWSSSSRFAGIQYSTNFEVDPNLITYPLVGFVGDATLPSTIDIYTKSKPLYKGEIRPGGFEISNIPISNGAGEFTVETRNILGEREEITLPYYISSELLKKGLSDYSFDFGVQRQFFSTKSHKYYNPLFNSNYLYGINDYWTTGAHLEAIKGSKFGEKSSIGATNKVKLHNYGVVSASIAHNLHNNIMKAQKFMVSYNYNNEYFSFGTRYSLSSKNFENIFLDKEPDNGKQSILFSNIAIYHPSHGSLSLNYLANQGAKNKLKTVSLNYSKNLTKKSNIRVSLTKNLIDKKDDTITLSYSLSLDNKNISTSVSKRKGSYLKHAQFSASSTKTEFGYSGSLAQNDMQNRYTLNVHKGTYQGNFAVRAMGYSNKGKNSHSQSISANGSLVFLDNDFYFSKPIHSSLGVVKVGEFKDIPVYRSNQLIGKTNSKGKVFVPNIVPYSSSKIHIDTNSMPINTRILATSASVAPRDNSGLLVNFEAKEHRSAIGVLVDQDEEMFEENYVILIEGLDEIYSGYDGLLYINDLGKLETIKGVACKHGSCYAFNVDIDLENKDFPLDLGEIYCRKIKRQE